MRHVADVVFAGWLIARGTENFGRRDLGERRFLNFATLNESALDENHRKGGVA